MSTTTFQDNTGATVYVQDWIVFQRPADHPFKPSMEDLGQVLWIDLDNEEVCVWYNSSGSEVQGLKDLNKYAHLTQSYAFKGVPVLAKKKSGMRNPVGQRWDLIPGGFKALSRVAEVSSYGAGKYGDINWKSLDISGEKAPINHALRHSFKALEYPFGSKDRTWQLAKAAWNLLAQLEFELKEVKGDE